MHLVGEIYQPQAAVCHIHGPQVQVGHGEEQGGQDPELCSGLLGSHESGSAYGNLSSYLNIYLTNNEIDPGW